MANEPQNRGVGEAAALIADLARQAAGEVTLDGVMLPEEIRDPGLPRAIPIGIRGGASPEILGVKTLFDVWRTAPPRRKGTATATTLASFIDLVNRHKDDDSLLFAQTTWPKPHLLAVIDYHETDGSPRFGEHRVRYDFPVTPAFKAWIDANDKPMGQATFAAFVEDRIAEMSVATEAEKTTFEPLFRTKFAVPTDLVDLARGLEVHVGGKVKNAFRTQTGEAEITFEETHQGKDGKPLFVPGLFVLRLPAFLDGGLVSLVARLRYRLNEGQLVWFYSLYQWEEVLRLRVSTDFNTAATQTALLAIEGAPEV